MCPRARVSPFRQQVCSRANFGQALPLGHEALVEAEKDPLPEHLDSRVDRLSPTIRTEVGANEVCFGVVTPKTEECPNLPDPPYLAHSDKSACKAGWPLRAAGNLPTVNDEVPGTVVSPGFQLLEECRPFTVLQVEEWGLCRIVTLGSDVEDVFGCHPELVCDPSCNHPRLRTAVVRDDLFEVEMAPDLVCRLYRLRTLLRNVEGREAFGDVVAGGTSLDRAESVFTDVPWFRLLPWLGSVATDAVAMQ
jgi:hypothetical protein